MIVLETTRLTVRRLTVEDAAFMLEMFFSSRILTWQRNNKLTALPFARTFGLNMTVMRLNNCLNNCQP